MPIIGCCYDRPSYLCSGSYLLGASQPDLLGAVRERRPDVRPLSLLLHEAQRRARRRQLVLQLRRHRQSSLLATLTTVDASWLDAYGLLHIRRP